MDASEQRSRTDGRGSLIRAVDALMRAYAGVRDDLISNEWALAAEPVVWAGDHVIVRFAMHRDGVVVSDCGFMVGPGRAVQFTRPAERALAGGLDLMGQAEFQKLIAMWVAEVQRGIGHRWRYEAKMRGPCAEDDIPGSPVRPLEPSRPLALTGS